MILSTILAQLEVLGIKTAPDSTAVNHIQNTADTVKAQVDSLASNIMANPAHIGSTLTDTIRDVDWSGILTNLSSQFIGFALRLLIAILLFYVGKFIINKIYSIVRAVMVRKKFDHSLITFLLSLIKITLMFLLIIVVIGIMGIETSSFIAIFASAGVAIGMALSGTLQNFAGGVLILLIKPYKVGDYIEFGNYKGHVKEIQIFHTVIVNYNNERIIIPNGGLSTGTINNYSAETYRRCQWKIAISYGDDVDLARKVAFEIIDADPRVVKKSTDTSHLAIEDDDNTPEPVIEQQEQETMSWWQRIFRSAQQKREQLKEEQEEAIRAYMPKKNYAPSVNLESLDDSCITLVIRAWVETKDYWAVLYSVNEKIYKQFPARGLHFPFPQLDVHMIGQQ